MGTRCRAYDFGISIIMLCAIVETRSFTWNLRSNLLIFGENVQLYSSGSACKPNTIKKWIGGPSYKILCYSGYSVDSSKYEIMANDTVADFGLMIKKIAVEDIYCRYTCTCGIHQHTKRLDLEGVDYIYPPDIHNNVTVGKDGTCHIDIQVDVYPVPRCVLTYEGNALPVNINKTQTKHSFNGGDLELYNVRIVYTMLVHSYISEEEMVLTCNIGRRNYTRSIDLCKDKLDSNTNTILSLIMAFGIVAFTIIVLRICCLIWNSYQKKKDYHENNGSQEIDGMMEESTKDQDR